MVVAAMEIAQLAQSRWRRNALVLAATAVLLLAAFMVAVGHGAVAIAPGEVLAILTHAAGLEPAWSFEGRQQVVLLAIRLPRALLAALVGAALAVSGAALQGLFRNPLADPALIGISNGAALAAATLIVLGGLLPAGLLALAGHAAVPLAAFAGALAATFAVYRIATRDGRTEVATMLLAGVAVNAMAAAGIGLLIFLSDDRQLRDLSFWMLGSLGGVTWDRLAAAAPLMLLPALALPLLARHLNALLLGESEALHLGFAVERAKRRIVVLTALAVGAAVSLTGVIGFVGLVVPHLVRLCVGADHRLLLPVSMLAGAALMLVADLLARLVVLPAELPVGILTACVGGPFFIWLLLRRRAQGLW